MDVGVRQWEEEDNNSTGSALPPVFQWPPMAYLIHSEEKHLLLPHLNMLKIIFSDKN